MKEQVSTTSPNFDPIRLLNERFTKDDLDRFFNGHVSVNDSRKQKDEEEGYEKNPHFFHRSC